MDGIPAETGVRLNSEEVSVFTDSDIAMLRDKLDALNRRIEQRDDEQAIDIEVRRNLVLLLHSLGRIGASLSPAPASPARAPLAPDPPAPASPAPDPPSPASLIVGMRQRRVNLVEIAHQIFLDNPGFNMIKAKEIARLVEERGGVLNGKNKSSNLVNLLMKDARFCRVKNGYYGLSAHFSDG